MNVFNEEEMYRGLEYILYCDESDREGKFFSNFYGAALVRSTDINQVEKELNDLKSELNLNAEIKWSKVPSHEAYFKRYCRVIDKFFEFVKKDLIKVRIMFKQNRYVPINLTKEQKDHEFLILYYEFLKHCFGLKYSDEAQGGVIKLKFYFDDLPIPRIDADSFKDFIYKLGTTKAYGDSFLILRENMAEVNSKNHVILQCLDIVLGSMCFRLNDKHREKPQGKYRRSKGTIYKEKMYKHILKHIRDIHPNFNIGVSTGRKEPCDSWRYSYSHWRFVSSNHTIDFSATKKHKK